MTRNLIIVVAVAALIIFLVPSLVGSVFGPGGETAGGNDGGSGEPSGGTQYYKRSVVIDGERHMVTSTFCNEEMKFSFTENTVPGPTPGSLSYWMVNTRNGLYKGHCTDTSPKRGSFPSTFTCENKYLDVCGSGTGIPEFDLCEDDEMTVALKGQVSVANLRDGIFNYDIFITHFSVLSITPQSLFSNDAEARITLYTPSGKKVGRSIDIPIKDLAKTTTETFQFTYPYKVYDLDCDNEPDDHKLNMEVLLFDEEGEQAERHVVTVGLNNGQLIRSVYGD